MSTHAFIPDPRIVQGLYSPHLSEDLIAIILITVLLILALYVFEKVRSIHFYG